MDGGEQLEMDFQGPAGDGYARWQADYRRLQESIAAKWSMPINRPVRLELKNVDGAFEGMLRLAERPHDLDSRRPLLLRLDRMTFFSNEIERCLVLAGGEVGAGASVAGSLAEEGNNV